MKTLKSSHNFSRYRHPHCESELSLPNELYRYFDSPSQIDDPLCRCLWVEPRIPIPLTDLSLGNHSLDLSYMDRLLFAHKCLYLVS